MGQIDSLLSNRPQESLPSNTETNLKAQVNAIILKSGKQLEQKQKEFTEKSIKKKLERKKITARER